MNGRQIKPEAPEVKLTAPSKPKTEAQEKLQSLEAALVEVVTAHHEWLAATEEILDGTRGAITQPVIDARKRLHEASKISARMHTVWQELDALTKLLRSYREAETF